MMSRSNGMAIRLLNEPINFVDYLTELPYGLQPFRKRLLMTLSQRLI